MTTTTDDTTQPPDDQQPDDQAPAQTDDHQEESPPDNGGEQKRRRAQLREVEAERDGLRDRLTRLQRREVERLASDVLANGTDLWDVGGAHLDDLLDDEGHVDDDAVATAAKALIETRGKHFSKRAAVGYDGGVRVTARRPRGGWAGAFEAARDQGRRR